MISRSMLAAAGLAAVAVPVAFATSGSAQTSSTSPSATPSTSAASSPSVSSSAAGSSPHVQTPIALRLKGKDVDPATLPDAGEVFTKNELAPLVRGLTATSATDGTVNLTITGEAADDRSHLDVDLPHHGTWKDVSAAWQHDKTLHEKRAHANPGLYTFFHPGTHGVSDAFTDGTTTYVLVHSGDAAATIRFSGIGCSTIAGSHAESRRAYTAKLVPSLVDLIGAKVHDGEAKAAKKPNPSPEAKSSSQSAAPSASSTS